MKRLAYLFSVIAILFIFNQPSYTEISVRIKDISFIDGLKENHLFGYGLVVGLQGTGDSKSAVTNSSLRNVLKNLGLEGDNIISKNTAAVLLTAKLPPFVRVGDRIDITVSSIGDAKSLEGGILIQSPLKGADKVIYAAVQGPLSIPTGGRGRPVKTVAAISGGGVIERDIIPNIVTGRSINLVLKNWDYTVADSIIKAVEGKYQGTKPVVEKGKIRIRIKKGVSLPEFISSILNLEITPADRARVVVNEKNGTIVAGGKVKISEAMVSREGMTIEIAGSDKKGAVSVLKESSTVKDLVDTLNSIGSSTRDIIAVLKALKSAGALHAELIVK